MKNRVEFKKYIINTSILIVIISLLFIIINNIEFNLIIKNYNKKINDISNILIDKYPLINKEDLINILNNNNYSSKDIFKEYGININKDSIVLENNYLYKKLLVFNISFILLSFILLVLLFIRYENNRKKELDNITKYIEDINNKNYLLNIDSNSEDELSILKNEIYKTTVNLKEVYENSLEDKINLKNSLEDISHQLKTPLTSILIYLDNLIDDIDMDKSTREEFIRDIKRNVININFLVQSLLKLAKFDSNTVSFIRKNTLVSDIINNSIKNVGVLIDLKNIDIRLIGLNDDLLYCDSLWQTEALTNIIKNSIEHSNNYGKITIEYNNNSIYQMIKITDNGSGIDKSEIKNIFNRFYKGSNSNRDSIGIGLSLAKHIIEEDNGTITVESNTKETTFIIKYYHY